MRIDDLFAVVITTERLELEPLRVDHAAELAPLLDDTSLHTYIGGHPASAEDLAERFDRHVRGHSPDGSQRWCNWVARSRESGEAVGTLQATVSHDGDQGVAELAWVLAARAQGLGYAIEAAQGVAGWLRRRGVSRFVAHIHPDHLASAGVARRLGLRPTEVLVDGEVEWMSVPADG